ncbi:MAG: DNA alkylation repair protein [Bacteroidales bacterium]|nr:DNA alkylation repair protein [Bacteroidales bacterium]
MVDKVTISRVHAKFRQLKSGEVADNLKAQGVTYRLNWGVQSYRMREIAACFEPSKELAEYLWQEDVRESKLLAPRLFPTDEMTPEDAARWVDTIPHIEVADQLAMHLLSKLSFAPQLCHQWIQKGQSDMRQYVALMTASRWDTVEPGLLERAKEIVNNDAPLWLRSAALRVVEMADPF